MTASTLNLRERWFAQRDRLLTSPRFREAASRFAGTRPIARQRARELFDLVAGYRYPITLAVGAAFGRDRASATTGRSVYVRLGGAF